MDAVPPARARLVLLAILLATAPLSACRQRHDREGPTATPAAASSPAAPTETARLAPVPSPTPGSASPGCGSPPGAGAVPGTTSVRTITAGGRERTYRLHVPAGYSTTTPLALVFNFHGLGSNAFEQEVYSGLVPLSDREGFLLVSPQGVSNSWLIAPGVDDVAFTRQVASALAGEFCIDTNRVYSTGMSNGAFMSSTLACLAGDLVAAVAPVAGVAFREGFCGRPTPVVAFHGTADAAIAFEGGTLPTGGRYAGVMPMMAGWAGHNGCDESPAETRVSPSVRMLHYQGCTAATALYIVDGGGHTWPGAIDVPRLGPTTKEISAAELIWSFFQSHPRR